MKLGRAIPNLGASNSGQLLDTCKECFYAGYDSKDNWPLSYNLNSVATALNLITKHLSKHCGVKH